MLPIPKFLKAVVGYHVGFLLAYVGVPALSGSMGANLGTFTVGPYTYPFDALHRDPLTQGFVVLAIGAGALGAWLAWRYL